MTPRQSAAALRLIASRIEASTNPSKSRVSASLKGLVRNIAGDFPENFPPEYYDGEASSQLLWHAMSELGMNNWDQQSDLNSVLSKMKELYGELGLTKNLDYAVNYAKKNFETFKQLSAEGKI